jgi:hypothetical protein
MPISSADETKVLPLAAAAPADVKLRIQMELPPFRAHLAHAPARPRQGDMSIVDSAEKPLA